MPDIYTVEYDQDIRVVPETKGIQVSPVKRVLLNGVPDTKWIKIHQYIIPPGGDTSSAMNMQRHGVNGELRRLVKSMHTDRPTLIARHKKQKAYREAKQAREQDDTPATRKAVRAAKKARDKAREAYKAFIEAEG